MLAVGGRSWFIISTLAMLTFLLAACGGRAPSGGSSGDPKQEIIRLGFSSGSAIENSLGYRALDLMAEDGWNIEVTTFNGSTTTTRALIAGEVDVVEVSATAALVALAEGGDFVAFASHDSKPKYVIVAKDSVKSLQDLYNIRFAVAEQQGIERATGSVIFKEEGLDWDRVNTVIIGGSGDRAKALLAGQVDATFLNFPQWPVFEREGGYHILAQAADYMDYMMDDAFWSTSSWLANHEEFAVALNKALLEAAAWLTDPGNKEEVLAYIKQKLPNMSEEDVAINYETLLRIGMWPTEGNLSRENAERTAATLVEYGIITNAPDVSKWVAPQYQEQARQGG